MTSFHLLVALSVEHPTRGRPSVARCASVPNLSPVQRSVSANDIYTRINDVGHLFTLTKYSSRMSNFFLFFVRPSSSSLLIYACRNGSHEELARREERKRTAETFWDCRSYRVCVNCCIPNDAPTMRRTNGTPNSAGCLRNSRLYAASLRGFLENVGICYDVSLPWSSFQTQVRSSLDAINDDR